MENPFNFDPNEFKRDVPEFIRLRGCINCPVVIGRKERGKTHYGFDHEDVPSCLVLGCIAEGHAVYNPFMDPEEVMNYAKKSGNKDYVENARKYVLKVKERFCKFYERMGINLDLLLET